MALVEVEKVTWLIPDKIPMGVVTVIAGRGGEGKSTWIAGVAARCSRGELDGDVAGGPVLMVGGEDDLATVLRPRLEAAGANIDWVIDLKIDSVVDGVTVPTAPKLPLDIGSIREAVVEYGAKLVVFDPLASSMTGNPDRLADVRQALDPLAALAAERGVAIVAVMHLRKGGGTASELLSGSHAFRDIARSVLLVITDPETGNRVMTVDKSNYSEARGRSYAFGLEPVSVRTGRGELIDVARAIDLGRSERSVDDIVNGEVRGARLSLDMQKLVGIVNESRDELGITAQQAANQAGMGVDSVRRSLSRLADRGLITRRDRGHYGPNGPGTESAGASELPEVSELPEDFSVRTHETNSHSPARSFPSDAAVR